MNKVPVVVTIHRGNHLHSPFWNLNEDGTLSALSGKTEFSHVPDWFEWERTQVKEQIARGEYSYEDDVEIYSQPRCWKFEKLGAGKLTHDVKEGFVVEGFYRGENYRVHRKRFFLLLSQERKCGNKAGLCYRRNL